MRRSLFWLVSTVLAAARGGSEGCKCTHAPTRLLVQADLGLFVVYCMQGLHNACRNSQSSLAVDASPVSHAFVGLTHMYTPYLQVECSSLTGESDLVPASVDKKHDLPAEARNLVFMSSLAMLGEGRGIVVRTGGRYISSVRALAHCSMSHVAGMPRLPLR